MDSGTIEWHERINFELKLCDIPRMMRLCFMLYTNTTGDRRARPIGKAGRLPTGGKNVKGEGKKVTVFLLLLLMLLSSLCSIGLAGML